VSDDSLDLLERALDQTGTLIAGVAPEQHALPTPCEDWDVAALVGHVLGGLDNFTASARGEKPDWAGGRPPVEGDWTDAFAAKAGTLLDTWRAADPEKRPGADLLITEQAVHAWDLASATGQPVAALDPAVAERALTWSHGMLKPEYRGAGGGGAIGAEVPVPDDAPVYARLAGWFGRDPAPWAQGN